MQRLLAVLALSSVLVLPAHAVDGASGRGRTAVSDVSRDSFGAPVGRYVPGRSSSIVDLRRGGALVGGRSFDRVGIDGIVVRRGGDGLRFDRRGGGAFDGPRVHGLDGGRRYRDGGYRDGEWARRDGRGAGRRAVGSVNREERLRRFYGDDRRDWRGDPDGRVDGYRARDERSPRRDGYGPVGGSASGLALGSPGEVEPGAFYGTTGAVSFPSVVVLDGSRGDGSFPEAREPGAAAIDGGPKIIRVAAARLDRRPYGEDGLDIVRAGATKIIRIAPGYPGRSTAESKDESALPPPRNSTPFAALPPSERAVTVYPDPEASAPQGPAAAPSPAAEVPQPEAAPQRAEAAPAAATAAEPWTAEWLRGCVARYPDFDASLGTYRDEAGRRRFCTGEP